MRRLHTLFEDFDPSPFAFCCGRIKMSMILSAFVGSFVERLVRFVEGKAATVLGVKKELKRLQTRLLLIENVLEDAERRSLEDFAIKNWVKELKDCMYDADDIMDLCMYKAAQLLDEQPSSSSSNPPQVRRFSFVSCCTNVPLRYEIGQRIKSLNDRLDEIYKDRVQFHFDRDTDKPTVTVVNRRQTSPVEAEFDIVGREIEDATKDLVKLMTESEGEVKRCRVFAITGMGGIGKTTLAGKIFNHWKVQARFQTKAWICISQTYNEIELLKQMIRATGVSYGEATTRAELVPALKSALSGKSIFLVLDDVWRSDVWIDLFRIPLQSAQFDSLVLITSRDENVSMQMGSVHIHHVMHLPIETGWEMLKRRLVVIGGRDEKEILNLREIGIQIIQKCSGLPLAIKAIAGVLTQKEPNTEEWKKILNHNSWATRKLHEELNGALYLSYDDLPSSLKQCFLYCSIFPEDFVFFCEQLVRLWVAEGFIKDEVHSLMEDKAEEYYHELIKRNLLQLEQLKDNGTTTCKMHDVFRSLAQIISGDEIFSKNLIDRSNIPSNKLRRLSINHNEDAEVILDAITKQRCLRTLLYFNHSPINYGNFRRLLFLRVLSIHSVVQEILPNAIGDMFHLRYLRLDTVSLKKLPESIGRLSNLQYLHLGACDELTNLPQSITRLKNLRSLIISDRSLAFIPKGIERLKQLNLLKGFIVRDDSVTSQLEGEQRIMHSTLTELSSLSNLRILHLFILKRARPGSLVLGELSQLKDLQLSCVYEEGWPRQLKKTGDGMSLIQKLFEELIPPQFLEKLRIECYFGHHYPKWIMSQSLGSHFPCLSILELVRNTLCTLLPPLGQLPNLRSLYIHDARAVKHIGPEFFGGGVTSSISQTKTAFPKLQVLRMSLMLNLEEWFLSDENEENDDLQKLVLFPRLHELFLESCPNLRALPSGLGRIALKRLTISGAYSIKEVVNLPRVTECVRLIENGSLERISNLPVLKILIVQECYSLTCVECLNGLQQLDLRDRLMNGLPDWLSRLAKEWGRGGEDLNAEDDFLLQLWCDKSVLQRCQQGGRDWPVIRQIKRVNAYALFEKFYLHFVKQPFFYEANIAL